VTSNAPRLSRYDAIAVAKERQRRMLPWQLTGAVFIVAALAAANPKYLIALHLAPTAFAQGGLSRVLFTVFTLAAALFTWIAVARAYNWFSRDRAA
jgi:hypothetical protein